MQRDGYDTDLTDADWESIAPFLDAGARRGPKQKYALREIVNAIYYVIITGVQWRNLPKDFPPYRIVYWHFMKWRDNDAFKNLHTQLRKQLRVRLGRNEDPSAGIIDSQTVKSTIDGESIRTLLGSAGNSSCHRHHWFESIVFCAEGFHGLSLPAFKSKRAFFSPAIRVHDDQGLNAGKKFKKKSGCNVG